MVLERNTHFVPAQHLVFRLHWLFPLSWYIFSHFIELLLVQRKPSKQAGTNLTKPDPSPIVNNLYFFGNLLDSFFSLFALQTTTNFPDIMLDVYCEKRSFAIYFVIFMFIQFFTLMNMIAGVFYFNYKNVLAEGISDYTKNRRMISLVQQFLTVENFNRTEFSNVFKKYVQFKAN